MAEKTEEYELMPIKPLNDLKKEVAQLRKELKKEDKMHKIMVKILNSNIEMQRNVMSATHKIEDVKNALHKFTKAIDEINEVEEQEDETEKKLNKMLKKINWMSKGQEKIIKNLGAKDFSVSMRQNPILPRRKKVVYKRTK